MKKFFAFLCFSILLINSSLAVGPATLSTGDIVIIGISSDPGDEFSWVPLVDLSAGEIIYFTSSGSFPGQGSEVGLADLVSNNSTLIKYTTPAGGVSAGVRQTVHDDGSGGYPAETTSPYSVVTATGIAANADLSLLTSGDQILAFQSTDAENASFTTTNFTPLFAATTHSLNWNSSTTTSGTNLYPGLTDTVNAVAAGSGTGTGDEYDNARYEGITTGTAAELLAAVADVDNWTGTGSTPAVGYTRDGVASDFTVNAAGPCVQTADTVQAGSGVLTSSGNTVTPQTTFFEDGRQQLLYLASEITASGGCAGNLAGMAFNFTSVSALPTNVTISLKQTTDASFSSFAFDNTGFTTVHSGSFTPVVGWNWFAFSSNFAWDGTSNIIVNYCYNNNSFTGNSTVQYETTSSNSHRYAYTDNTDGCTLSSFGVNAFRANVRFRYPVPTVVVTPTDITCNGLTDGQVSAQVSDGTANYKYVWSTGDSTTNTASTTNQLTGLSAGTYTVTVTDADGKTAIGSATIAEPAVLVSAAIVDSNVTCNGLSDGGATASGTGGTMPYSYEWSNSAMTASITGVAAGTYSVTITDARGCTDSSSVTITQPAVLVSAAIVDSNVTCNGLLDGGATASGTGGTMLYSYEWSNSAMTASITGVAAGTYSVTITDARGCTDSSSVTITQPAVLTAASIVDSNVTCNGLLDGGATASGTGGTMPYSYQWSNSAMTASISGVAAGTYSVTITDAKGCTDSSSVTITQPAVLTAASIVDSNVTCNGLFDGGATASGTGGTMPYNYQWSNSAMTASISGVAAGTYSVTITDAKGCTDSSSVTITQPAVLTAASIVDSNVTCNGLLDGGATASGTGGTMPYNYEWSNSAMTASISGVASGTYSVTITDAKGCTDSSSVTITQPAVLTAASIVDSNVTCSGLMNGGATASGTGGTMPYSYEWSNSAMTASISGVAAGTYSVTITDARGCTDTSSVTVLVNVDVTPPVITTCAPTPSAITANASCQAATPDLTGMVTATDNCTASPTITQSPTAGTMINVGMTTITITATDGAGNTDTCMVTQAVTESTPPTAVTQNITVYLDGTGNVSIVPGDVDNGSSDNCALASLALDQTSFTCADVGTNTVTLTATDASGNQSNETATVTVADTTSPTAVAQNVTIYLDGTGNASITTGDINNGSSDNCSLASLGLNQSSFTCSDVGANSVTLTVTDANSNQSTATATVTVMDTTSPTAVTQNVTVYLDGTGNASISTGDINNGSSDNCSLASLGLNQSSFTCSDVGANSVTLTVTDANSNQSTATATVTVMDTTSPTAVAQNVTVYLDGTGNASVSTGDINNGSSDNCSLASLGLNQSSFTCSDVGANSVTLTVTDANSNQSTATATVTVIDTTSPTAVAQNVTVYLDGTGNASITTGDINNGSSDNCSLASLGLNQSSFTCSDVGANTVTLTVTDANSNQSTATATVTVMDTTSPTAVAQNVTVYLDGTGNASVSTGDINNGSSDNCSLASLGLNQSSFTCSDVGANSVTLTVTDANSNQSTATATVTVMDTTSPTAVAQNVTVYLDGTGNASITTGDINNGSSDNCSLASLGLNQSSFTCADTGMNTVTLTVTDANSNQSTATATVTVMDTTSPTAVAQNITVYLDASGQASITTGDIDNGSSDNCAIVSQALDITSFTCADTGMNTVTLTVTDVSSNQSTATATVMVMDTMSPTAVAQNIMVYLDGSGNASIVPADIDNGSSDNCSTPTLSLDNMMFTCADTGMNTVTLTATDVSGNQSTATATVTVEDTTSPTAVAQNITVYLDGTGNASIVPGDVDNGSSDNCGIASLSLDNMMFTCADTGMNTVTLTVTDVSSNQSTATATVMVMDTTSPTAVAQNITVYLDGTGNASIVPGDVDNGSSDNCGIASLSLDNMMFTCADTGMNTVTLTATDVSGNQSTATAMVTVEDTTSPTAVAQNITVYLDGSGQASITTGDIDNGSSDNCAIASLALNTTSFTCSDVGANMVVLTVTDVNSNTDTAHAAVTVMDTLAPNTVTQNVTMYLDAAGTASITTGDIDNGSADNCGLASLALDMTSFTCAEVGANTVVLTATDVNGNSDTAHATVMVMDTVLPNVVTQNITVYLDAAGSATIVPADVDNGSSDNCTIASQVLDITSFTCAEVGPNTVWLTVTDVNGNADSAMATVMVMDTLAPNVVTQNITVYLDAAGQASITTGDVDNGSSDNCAIASQALDITSFTCAEVGPNTVWLTVTDVNGNSDSATATVTVMDTLVPLVATQNITVYLDAAGQASITTGDIDNGSSDNCGVASLSLDITSFSCAEVGANSVVLTATDVNSNTDTAHATVMVMDTLNPLVATQNITVYLDAAGAASIVPGDVDNGSSDNCTIDTRVLDISSFSCAEVGANTVVLTVTDVNSNSDTAHATVTVMDTLDPLVVAQNITVYLDAAGQVSITANDVDNGSSDNCTVDQLTLDITSFDCSNVGPNAVVLTVSDVNGNSDTAHATVMVMDTLAPLVVTQNVTVYLDGAGQASITVTDIDNGSSDNCAIDTRMLDITSFSCAEVGANTVVLTVTDVNGNADTAHATVMVMDTIAPTITCPVDVTVCDNSVLSYPNPVVVDNCNTNLTLLNGPANGSTVTVGSYVVEIEAEDPGGNTATCTFNVEVVPNPTVDLGTDLTIGANSLLNFEVDSNFANITWSTGATTPGIDPVVTMDTSFSVTVVDSNGCVATDTVNIAVLLSTGDRISEGSLQLFPNPTRGPLSLRVTGTDLTDLQVVVVDMNGKEVQTFRQEVLLEGQPMEVDMSNLSRGVYFIRILSNEHQSIQRIIRQ